MAYAFSFRERTGVTQSGAASARRSDDIPSCPEAWSSLSADDGAVQSFGAWSLQSAWRCAALPGRVGFYGFISMLPPISTDAAVELPLVMSYHGRVVYTGYVRMFGGWCCTRRWPLAGRFARGRPVPPRGLCVLVQRTPLGSSILATARVEIPAWATSGHDACWLPRSADGPLS